MSKGSPELAQARREEIVNACAKLYETMSFKEITIKEIAASTSFTRTSIYNYFQTKEEIFLALLQREYEEWSADLDALQPTDNMAPRQEVAKHIAHTLERRECLLKLLSMNLNDMEANSSMEHLVSFKAAYGKSIQAVKNCLQRFCSELVEDELRSFTFSFLPLVYGIYPYTAVTQKQRIAMKQAHIDFQYQSIYDISLIGVQKLLGM